MSPRKRSTKSPRSLRKHSSTVKGSIASSKERVFAVETPAENLVCVAFSDVTTGDDLCVQLGFYGFQTILATDEAQLLRAVSSAVRVVLVVELSALDNGIFETAAIRELQQETDRPVRLVVVSQDDGFDLRLRAVRAGADAFFPIPLEIARVSDKIDSLFGQNARDPFHVLIVGDNPEEISDYAHMLQHEGMLTSVVSDPRHLLSVLIESKPELILMDLQMAEWSGVELTQVIRQLDAFIGIPIIFIADDSAGLETRLQAIELGGDEFVNRPVIRRYLGELMRLRAARSRTMRFFMERDSLTGLLNHSNLREKLAAEMRRAERIGNELCFCMIDIDHFKQVNDTYGHLTGDRVLKSLSRLLQDRLRKTDVVGRYGGEEFGVILFDTTLSHAERIMNEIRESFAHVRQQAQDKEFFVTFSCGIASYPTFSLVNELNEAADRAMYEAKQRGRNLVCTI